MNEFNFFASSLESDKNLFFGPIEPEDVFTLIQNDWTMANIMFTAGIFPSVTQARKNGFNKPIPDGFSDMRVGKTKLRVVIFKERQSAGQTSSS